jgi:glycerol kinase
MPGKAPSDDRLFLALDVGGHAARTIVFDAAGAAVAEGRAAIETQRPGPDRVEHDGGALARAVTDAVARAAEALGPRAAAIAAAGLATQRSTIACWDRATGEALCPVISWQDRRAAAWLAAFAPRAAEVRSVTGLVLSPHYGASKLRWCLDHVPRVREAQRRGRLALGPLASFLLCRILEERPVAADPANASRTLLWDAGRRDWSPALLDLFGVPRAALPRCVPSAHAYGTLAVGARRVPLVVCTGDQSAALFGGGAPREDTAYVNVGTGAFLQRVTGSARADAPRLLASVIWQEGERATYVMEGTVNGAGSALEEVGRALGFAPGEVDAGAAAWLAAAADPPLFLNGVSGLGSPWWVPRFESRFVGAGTPQEKIAGVLESIVFLLAVNLDEMRAARPGLARVLISGGISVLDEFCRRLAGLAGAAVERPSYPEATARGLAYLVAGRPGGWAWPPPLARFDPAPGAQSARRFDRWRAIIEEAVKVR